MGGDSPIDLSVVKGPPVDPERQAIIENTVRLTQEWANREAAALNRWADLIHNIRAAAVVEHQWSETDGYIAALDRVNDVLDEAELKR